MSDHTTIEQLVQCAFVLFAKGNTEEALLTLQGIQTKDAWQKREIAYIRARCFIARACWDEAAPFLLSPDVSGESLSDISTLGQTERRRRASYLLLLGNVAVKLGRFQEATRHYTQCIQCLNERRMNDVRVRASALCGLGTAFTALGSYASALAAYERALPLCGEDSQYAGQVPILIGLCTLHRHLGNVERARAYGQEALQLCGQCADMLSLCRVHVELGHLASHVGDLQTATTEYTEALALAKAGTHRSIMIQTLTALADLRVTEGKLEEAWSWCECARQTYTDAPLCRSLAGPLSFACGKVMHAQAHKTTGQCTQKLIEQASTFYLEAIDAFKLTGKGPELADAYGRMAQVLEMAGQQELALACWKLAYAARGGSEDVLLI